MVKQEWDTVMDWVKSNSWADNGSRNCAVEQMQQDGCEEIGSSDINCTIYDRLSHCTEDTYFSEIVNWAKELGKL